jgi:hypothetical protein
MDSKLENQMFIFNEVMVTVFIYILMSITEFNVEIDSDLRELQSWLLVGTLMLAVGVNLLKFILCASLSLIKRLNLWIRRVLMRTRRKEKYEAS